MEAKAEDVPEPDEDHRIDRIEEHSQNESDVAAFSGVVAEKCEEAGDREIERKPGGINARERILAKALIDQPSRPEAEEKVVKPLKVTESELMTERAEIQKNQFAPRSIAATFSSAVSGCRTERSIACSILSFLLCFWGEYNTVFARQSKNLRRPILQAAKIDLCRIFRYYLSFSATAEIRLHTSGEIKDELCNS